MTIQARLEILDPKSRRTSPRRKLRLGSTIAGRGVDVVIHDLSVTGVLLQTSAKLEPFDDFEIDLPEMGATNSFVVWNSGDFYGCEFANPITKAAVSAAQLRNPIARTIATPRPADQFVDLEQALHGNEFSHGTKLRVIVGTSIALWTLILWALGII